MIVIESIVYKKSAQIYKMLRVIRWDSIQNQILQRKLMICQPASSFGFGLQIFSKIIVTFAYLAKSDEIIMNDAQLVQQVLNGNNHAFRFLVGKYQRLVTHVVGRIIQQEDELEDICQEVFIKVFKTLNRFRGDSKLSTWIATIAYNTAITHYRKQKRRGELSYNEEPNLIFAEEDPGLNQKRIEKEEAKKYLLQLIESLPVNYRTVITLYHLEEFSYKEMEEITGMPQGTIKSYLNRARKLLKGKIEKVARLEQTNIFVDYV